MESGCSINANEEVRYEYARELKDINAFEPTTLKQGIKRLLDAGFSKKDINLTLEKGVLTITGKKVSGADTREYAHRGISQRAFERSFTIADTIKVVGADIVDGMLVVILENW